MFFNQFFEGGDDPFGGQGGFPGGGMPGGKKAKKNVNTTRFYEILGVDKDASPDQLRKAYKKLAAKAHPDKEGGSQEKFQELQGAYEVLSDPEKREIYNKYGEEGLKEGMGGGGEGADIFDLLMNRGGGGGGKKQKAKSKSLLYPLKVTLEDVYCGNSKFIDISRYRICDGCKGSGSKDPNAETKCSGCKGNGRKTIIQRIPMGMVQQVVDCTDCNGTGTKISEKDKCKICKGSKAVQKSKALEVSLDKGVNDGKRYTFEGESDEVPDVMAGDVIVEIQIEKHPLFTRKGADLVYKQKITMLQALTGFECVFTHLDKRQVHLTMKKGEIIAPGVLKTCTDLGMPFFESPFRFGNLYLDFQFVFPKTINDQQKEALYKIFPNDVPRKITEKIEERYTLTDFKDSEQNTHHSGGKTGARMEEDDEESGGPRNVQCQNQ